MLNPETWIKLLFTYGPFALLIFFVFVIENKARATLNESPAERKTPFLVVYLGVWAGIFLLVVFIGYAWTKMNLSSEYTITGTFENLSGDEKIVSRQDNLFLCRHRLQHGRFDESWRLISPKKLETGTRIKFIFDRGRTEASKENETDHELVVCEEFYKAPVVIRYQRDKKKLILKYDGKETEIPPLDYEPKDGLTRLPGFFIGMAHAGETPNPVAFAKLLESDDPFIRRDARVELGKMEEAALPYIQTVLGDPKSSYRLRVGVITALGTMEHLKLAQLSPATINALIEASSNKDAALRNSALRLFRKYPIEVEQALNKARKEGANPERISRLDRIKFENLYYLGVQEKDAYGHYTRAIQKKDEAGIQKYGGKDHFQAALNYFQEAWGLRTLAVADDQIYFTKALYGWGHTLHDRSWLETPGGQRQPELIKAAQDKFKEFLQAFETDPHKDRYFYPDHEKYARNYLKDPVSQSLIGE